MTRFEELGVATCINIDNLERLGTNLALYLAPVPVWIHNLDHKEMLEDWGRVIDYVDKVDSKAKAWEWLLDAYREWHKATNKVCHYCKHYEASRFCYLTGIRTRGTNEGCSGFEHRED